MSSALTSRISIRGIYNTNVTTYKDVSKYTYNARQLIFTYAIAFGSALISVIMGLNAYIANGKKSCNCNFSTMLCATRNPALDAIVKRESNGFLKAPPEVVLQMRLRYGVWQGVDEQTAQETRAGMEGVGFGLPEQVIEGEKGYKKVSSG